MTFLAAWLAKYALGRWLQANWRLVLIGAGVFALLGGLWWAYSAIWHKGYDAADNKWKDAQRAAEAKAAADTKLLQSAIAEIDTGITIDMGAINAVRTVYRDKIQYKAVDVYRDKPDCSVPDELRGQINAAAENFRSAATGSGGPAVHTAKPAP